MPTKDLLLRIDPTAPIVTVSSLRRYTTGDVDISWGVSENLSGLDRVETSIDGSSFQNQGLATSCALADLSEGNHTLVVRAVDMAGNIGERTVTFMVDSRAPYMVGVIASGTTGQNGWYTSDVSVDLGHISDNTSGIAEIRYRMFGGDWQTYTGAFELHGTGSIMLQVTAVDGAGNQMPTEEVLLKIDPNAPILSVSGQATYTADDVTIQWSVSENISGISRIETSMDGGTFKSMGLGTAFDFTGLSEGQHTLIVRAVDMAGNVAEKTVSFTVQTGATPPSPPAGPNPLIYGLAGAAIAGAVAIALMLLMRRRKGLPTAHVP